MPEIIVKSGEKYNRLTIVKEVERMVLKCGQKPRKFLCLCECGNTKEVLLSKLRKGDIKSCGCYRKEISTKHGYKHTSIYNIWVMMKQRCLNTKNKDYPNWGGRGITVCDRWLESFNNFLEDMGQKPENNSLDRINNDGNYEPSNCRWATSIQQQNNRRTSKKNKITQ
jgi:hypothetical protein